MKSPYLLAIFFPLCTFSGLARENKTISTTTTYVIRESAYVLPDSVNTLSAADARRLPAIAERASRQRLTVPRPTYSGILPRLATARNPAEMVNPLAPRDYGAGWNLVNFTERDPYRTVTPNTNTPQPTGLRVFGVREIW